MVAPEIGAALISALASSAKAGQEAFSGARDSAVKEKDVREKKRKTLAELLNASLGRELQAGEGQRTRGANIAGSRANALQQMASNYVQALR